LKGVIELGWTVFENTHDLLGDLFGAKMRALQHTTPLLALAEEARNHWCTHLLDTCGGEPRKNKSKKGTKHLAAAVTVTTRTSDPACNFGSGTTRERPERS
jgi:hypothetical protein